MVLSRSTRKPSASSATWTVTENLYDDDSRVTTRRICTNPGTYTAWQETHYAYDERSRRISLTRADGDVWSYRYDANSNMTGWSDPIGTSVENHFDERNLLVYRTIERGDGIMGATSEVYSYDGLGRLVSCANFDDTRGHSPVSDLISQTSWQYNTLSMAERQTQTIADYRGTVIGTYTTGAAFDGTGFNTELLHWDGTKSFNVPDDLNRLAASYFDHSPTSEGGNLIASYAYAGPNRLIQRFYGNGVRTDWQYESSGCGCGGFSGGMVEAITHTAANGETLWKTERRYDVVGNVTAERRAHQGNTGRVYAYDDTYRLTDSYFSVDLTDTMDFEDYAQGGSTPGAGDFAIKRSYNLDERGNRDGANGVRDTDSSGATIRDESYSFTDGRIDYESMNLYAEVDGLDLRYDEIEQMIYDESTGLYYAYDYRGQLIAIDEDAPNSPLATPAVIMSYDNQGHQLTEQRFTDVSSSVIEHQQTDVLFNGMIGAQMCPMPMESVDGEASFTLDDYSGMESATVYYATNDGTKPGSSHADHPGVAANPRLGGGRFNNIGIAQTTTSSGTSFQFPATDQLGSTIGTTNENGNKDSEFDYSDWGETQETEILLHVFAHPANLDAVTYDSMNGWTTIEFDNTSIFPSNDYANGALLQFDELTLITLKGRVLDSTTGSVVVSDPGGLIKNEIYNAPSYTNRGFSIINAVDGTVADAPALQTSGEWTSAASYSGGTGLTTLTHSGAGFASVQVGWFMHLSQDHFLRIRIASVPSSSTVTVAGDFSGIVSNGDTYTIYAPTGTNQLTGATETDADARSSYRYLFAGYRYLRPVAGFYNSGSMTTVGAQLGDNKKGLHQAKWRAYSPGAGRWLSQDPLSSDLANNSLYTSNSPVSHSDPSGLVFVAPNPGLPEQKAFDRAGGYQEFAINYGDELPWLNCARIVSFNMRTVLMRLNRLRNVSVLGFLNFFDSEARDHVRWVRSNARKLRDHLDDAGEYMWERAKPGLEAITSIDYNPNCTEEWKDAFWACNKNQYKYNSCDEEWADSHPMGPPIQTRTVKGDWGSRKCCESMVVAEQAALTEYNQTHPHDIHHSFVDYLNQQAEENPWAAPSLIKYEGKLTDPAWLFATPEERVSQAKKFCCGHLE